MFGISSTEFLLIIVIALVVIGPQKLPEMIRTVGKFVGKIQHFTRSIKNELTNELELDEIKKSIEELKHSSELQKLRSELNSAKTDVEKSMNEFEASALETKSQVEDEAKKFDAYLDVYEAPEKGLADKVRAMKPSERGEMDAEESFDLAFDEAFLKAEAEFIEDHAAFEYDVMTEAPKGFASKVKTEQDPSTIIRKIVQMRQAEIAAETDDKVATQFAFLQAKQSRQLLDDDEIRRRMTVRQLELNR